MCPEWILPCKRSMLLLFTQLIRLGNNWVHRLSFEPMHSNKFRKNGPRAEIHRILLGFSYSKISLTEYGIMQFLILGELISNLSSIPNYFLNIKT